MNINWQVRIKNPMFWIGLIGVVSTTVLTYFNMAASDVITWDNVGDLIVKTFQNPYLCCMIITSVLSFVGVLTDPTTKGLSDSARALGYDEPHDDTAGLR